jgi:hypothetical protein
MGYIVWLEGDQGVDLIPDGENVSVADGVLHVRQGTTAIATYREGAWKMVREDGRVTRYINKKLFPISITQIEEGAAADAAAGEK